jgi:hypothetical protein
LNALSNSSSIPFQCGERSTRRSAAATNGPLETTNSSSDTTKTRGRIRRLGQARPLQLFTEIIGWAHVRHFFTPAKMIVGYRLNSSPLQATHQFNPSQPTKILSMKKHWLLNQTLTPRTMSQGSGKKYRTNKENSTVTVELRFG